VSASIASRSGASTCSRSVRELREDEADRLDAAMRDDYAPLFDFVRATGQRKSECYLLRWAEVDWGARQIKRKGKGGAR
jgi:integrase